MHTLTAGICHFLPWLHLPSGSCTSRKRLCWLARSGLVLAWLSRVFSTMSARSLAFWRDHIRTINSTHGTNFTQLLGTLTRQWPSRDNKTAAESDYHRTHCKSKWWHSQEAWLDTKASCCSRQNVCPDPSLPRRTPHHTNLFGDIAINEQL